MNKCLVVIPTYNERENLPRLVPQVLAQSPQFEVLIVDDNSPDGTGEVADSLVRMYDGRVNVLHRAGKNGLGTAYLAGFRWGLERGYDYLFEMDADFSHKPEYLSPLLVAAQRTGLSVGSRLVAGGGVEGWPWYRKLISRGGSLYSRSVLGLRTHDCTSGFKCFARRTLQILDLPQEVRSLGFGFQVEVNCLAEWQGFEIAEVPIIFPDRVLGKSKMSRKIFVEAFLMVWKLRERRANVQAQAGLGRAEAPADAEGMWLATESMPGSQGQNY